MATKIWNPTQSGAHAGDWSYDNGGAAGSNWLTTAFAVTTKPANGDDVVFMFGSQAVNAGLDQHTVTLASLKVEDGYTGAIGSATGALQINVSATIKIYGTSGLWLTGSIDGATVLCLPKGVTCSMTFSSVGPAYLTALRGNISLAGASGATVANLLVGYLTAQASDVTVSVAASLPVNRGISVGGVATIAAAPTSDWTAIAGTVTQTAGLLPCVYLHGGKYIYNARPASGSLSIQALAGTFDASGSCGPIAVITTSAMYGTATVNLANGSNDLSGSINVYGNMPVLDPGVSLGL